MSTDSESLPKQLAVEIVTEKLGVLLQGVGLGTAMGMLIAQFVWDYAFVYTLVFAGMVVCLGYIVEDKGKRL